MTTSYLGAAERAGFAALERSSGFRFSVNVQHSWCARRAVNEGLLTLSVLRDDVRLRLLGAWMGSCDNLLDFMEGQLPDPSAELAVCRFEQLSLRAHKGAVTFKTPDPKLFDPRRVVRRSSHAGLAQFPTEPALLVAPGLRSLCRRATPQEKQLWLRLTAPTCAALLIQEGRPRECLETLLQIGALEYAC